MLPGYNSKEGHETPSLLDSVIGAVSGAWESGSDWLEEKGTAVKEAGIDFLESYPEKDTPYKDDRKYSEWTEEEKEDLYQDSDDMVDFTTNFLGGGVGKIVRDGGKFIMPKLAELGKKATKKNLGPVAKAREEFKFSENVDFGKMFKGVTDEKQVVDLWNTIRHQMSNYEVISKTLDPRQHNAFMTHLYGKSIRGLEQQGNKFASDVLRKQLAKTTKRYW